MKKQSTFLITAIAALTFAFVSCGGGDSYNFGETPPGAVQVTGVSLSPTMMSLRPGSEALLTATIQPSNATNKSVTWTSSNNAVASVSSFGFVTAQAAGTARITVTTQDGSRTAYCDVTVSTTNIPVTGVSLSQTTMSLTPGGTGQLTATIQPSNATNKNVTWTSSNNAVASVSSSGLVTAQAAGTARITVTTQDGSRTAYCDVTVSTTNISVTSVSLNQTTMSLTAGGTDQLTAAIQPSNATNKNVTWTSSNSAVAAVSSSGLVTAQAAGTARITVTTQDSSRTAYCDVTVNTTNIPVTGVSLNQTTMSLTTGNTGQLTATIQPSNATNRNVSWTSSNSAVASVSSSGLVTAQAAGTARITVTTQDGSRTAYCDVTVSAINVTSVTLNKNTMTLTEGGSEQLTHTIQPSNASNKAVTWTSSNTNVAIVSNGMVAAIAKGNAKITLRTVDGGYTASCDVTVAGIYVTGSVYLSNSTNYVGMLWKDHVRQRQHYIFRSVFVSGGDVYVAGQSGISYAALWVNGVAQYLGGDADARAC